MAKNIFGFTLLELLAVLVIMAALAVIAVPLFMSKGDEAKQVANEANLKMLQTQAQSYLWQEDVMYPQPNIIDDIIAKGYIKEKPMNPLKTGDYVVSVDTSGAVTVGTSEHTSRLGNITLIKVGRGSDPVWDNPFSRDILNYTVSTTAGNVKITPLLEDTTSTYTMRVNGNVLPTTENVAVPSNVTIEVNSPFGIDSIIYTLALTH